ncbi:hypothetical protein [Aestuariirhabdus litorea]|uniref:Uncharacterized protein n=1 Tax=Aestuariirhabdus litorea TaxID=2528527 RepID=A0A3P3VRX5_9GAMM|nr:hypothetical protein [Aestuariirhabdus litorea]RRJ85067.1 hypothetical protein D0544_08320 [Aestuariirhabdus litorea]RWW98292.1 hypothetical protein DZC74_08315 [Endozoicomonadaceae bacterium GTF-13]
MSPLSIFASILLSLLGGLLFASPLRADCTPMAATDYERIYCQIRSQGRGASLPDFAQFQSNPPATQRLLLRRPAQKLGIRLPDDSRGTGNKAGNAIPEPLEAEPQRQHESVVGRPALVTATVAPSRLAQECLQRLQGIDCAGAWYRLQPNLPNRALKRGVLEEGNRLGLPRFSGDKEDSEALGHYLSEAYRHYIHKMLEIGLGGVTMTYSRFYYSYLDLHQAGHDFVDRFETMYDYLKRDKRQLAVGGSEAPAFESLEYCMALDRRLIVCDNQRTNWVYSRDLR